MKERTPVIALLRDGDPSRQSWELSPTERAALAEPRRCDFCLGRLVVRLYPRPAASPVAGAGESQCGPAGPRPEDWGACRICAALIDAADQEGILRRVLTGLTAAARRERGAEPDGPQIEQARRFCDQFFACHPA